MKIENLKDKFISKYFSVKSFNPTKVSLLDELGKIKSGEYQNIIKACREAYKDNPLAYKKMKSDLPGLTFCGVFKGSHKQENLDVYNNIIILDIDHIAEDELAQKKIELFLDPYVFACWISPSGHGLKLLLFTAANQLMHKLYFVEIAVYFMERYDVQVDTSGIDVCRLCFVSHDEELFLKEDFEIVTFDDTILNKSHYVVKQRHVPVLKKIHEPFNINVDLYQKQEKALLYKTEGRNEYSAKESIKKIINYLTRTNQSITGTYQDWLKVGFSIANSFTYDLGKVFFLQLCRLDGITHDEYKSICLLEYCYRKRRLDEVNFASIVFLAKKKGFNLPIKKVANK